MRLYEKDRYSQVPTELPQRIKAALLIRTLYKVARTANTINTLTSDKPRRIGRRAKNIVVGKSLAKAGFFRRLFR